MMRRKCEDCSFYGLISVQVLGRTDVLKTHGCTKEKRNSGPTNSPEWCPLKKEDYIICPNCESCKIEVHFQDEYKNGLIYFKCEDCSALFNKK